MASIDLVDAVTVFPKNGGEIGLRTEGIPCLCPKEKNNAYKAAKAFFAEREGSADIVIEKHIPVGGGLRGRGERVEYLESGVSLPLLALLSDYPVNTAECYRKCDELGLCPVNGTAKAAESLQRGDIAALKANLFNGMTEAAKRLNGQIGGNLAALESAGGAALMSGSGGTTFAVFETEAERPQDFAGGRFNLPSR